MKWLMINAANMPKLTTAGFQGVNIDIITSKTMRLMCQGNYSCDP